MEFDFPLRNRDSGMSGCLMAKRECEVLSRSGSESVLWLVDLRSVLRDSDSHKIANYCDQKGNGCVSALFLEM